MEIKRKIYLKILEWKESCNGSNTMNVYILEKA